MHAEDRVLVAVMNRPKDFDIARDQGWYRVPQVQAPLGLFSEYLAFYFTAAFGQERWAVHYYARLQGHELRTRRELLPDEADHPRAGEIYYQLQLGPLQRREPPIVSQRWRRITFIHTTWDRFQAAREINDLFATGGEFVDRLYHALREAGLPPERDYPLREAGTEYLANLALPCRQGLLGIDVAEAVVQSTGRLIFRPETVAADPATCLQAIHSRVQSLGGLLPLPAESE
jgi:hypothetical protein